MYKSEKQQRDARGSPSSAKGGGASVQKKPVQPSQQHPKTPARRSDAADRTRLHPYPVARTSSPHVTQDAMEERERALQRHEEGQRQQLEAEQRRKVREADMKMREESWRSVSGFPSLFPGFHIKDSQRNVPTHGSLQFKSSFCSLQNMPDDVNIAGLTLLLSLLKSHMFFSLRHFGHGNICVTVVSKLAITVFISLYFQTF